MNTSHEYLCPIPDSDMFEQDINGLVDAETELGQKFSITACLRNITSCIIFCCTDNGPTVDDMNVAYRGEIRRTRIDDICIPKP